MANPPNPAVPPTNPSYEGATIAAAETYVGQNQPIGGPDNLANPPTVIVGGFAPVINTEIVGGAANHATPPEVVVVGFAPALTNEIVGGANNIATPPYVLTLPAEETSDAFGRQTISQSNSIFDAKFRFDLLPVLFDATGSVAWISNSKCARLSVTGAQTALMRSHQVFLARVGQSLKVNVGFLSGVGVLGITKRIGYFDNDNGIFLQVGPADVRFVIRSTVTGATLDTNFAVQADWNIDNLLGGGLPSNPSGLTLDLDKAQILVIDFQFLGTGRVRLGFNINGSIIWCHQFNSANISSSPYMQTCCLPVSAEVTSTVGLSSLDIYAAGVIREGSSLVEQCYQADVSTRAVSSNGQTLVNNISETVLVVGVRAGFEGTTLRFVSSEVFTTGNRSIYYEAAIYRGATPPGLVFNNCGTASKFSTTVLAAPANPIAVAGSNYVVAAGFASATQGQRITSGAAAASTGIIFASGTDLIVIRGYGIGSGTAATAQFALQFEEYY